MPISRTTHLQHPVGIPPERTGKDETEKSTEKQQIQTIISPNESITIILTAIQLFHISVLGGAMLRAFSDPSPLRSACQPASRAEQGRRNSGHNEIDDNTAEDGATAVRRCDDPNSPSGPEMKRRHSSRAERRRRGIINLKRRK